MEGIADCSLDFNYALKLLLRDIIVNFIIILASNPYYPLKR